MLKKELHIITVGNSLITNFQRSTGDQMLKSAKMGDSIWEKKLQNPAFLNEVFDFLKSDYIGEK